MPQLHWLQLALTDGLGPILIGRLVESQGSADKVCRASLAELRAVEGIGAAKAERVREALRRAAAAAEGELARAEHLGVAVVCMEDDRYPALLKSIPDPPPVLYVKGTLEPRDLNALAIVGSRRCSFYGREQAERFAALLAAAGFTVVSGGARGVDSCAHRGALQHPQGRTVAVLGCGIDVVYPPENRDLFDQVAGRGAVVSEYPLGTPPLAENFPRRNRIISGMSRGVLVVEADERSGALVTARQAADDHNRPVFAVPGRVDNPLSAGPHKLIRDGAVLAANLDHILEALGPVPAAAAEPSLFPEAAGPARGEADVAAGNKEGSAAVAVAPPPAAAAPDPSLTDRQRTVLAALSEQPLSVEVLIDRTALPAGDILRELTLLTLRGRVKRIDGQTFARRTFINP